MIYRVQIQIQEVDEGKNHSMPLGRSYEAGQFNSEKAARNFVENELLIIRAANTKLRGNCRAVLRLLSGLGKSNLKTTMENRNRSQFFE